MIYVVLDILEKRRLKMVKDTSGNKTSAKEYSKAFFAKVLTDVMAPEVAKVKENPDLTDRERALVETQLAKIQERLMRVVVTKEE